MKNIEKAKSYAGVLIVLQDNNVLSMLLYMEYKKSIMRDCNISEKEMDDLIAFAKENVDLDSSVLYVDWKT